jgi:hypothetical protein
MFYFFRMYYNYRDFIIFSHNLIGVFNWGIIPIFFVKDGIFLNV